MVIYSKDAIDDFESILYGLATWQKHPLELEHARKYVKDLRLECDTISQRTYHRNCKFESLRKHGNQLYVYKRNYHTQWNIIYNWQAEYRVAFINKIVNNYLTK